MVFSSLTIQTWSIAFASVLFKPTPIVVQKCANGMLDSVVAIVHVLLGGRVPAQRLLFSRHCLRTRCQQIPVDVYLVLFPSHVILGVRPSSLPARERFQEVTTCVCALLCWPEVCPHLLVCDCRRGNRAGSFSVYISSLSTHLTDKSLGFLGV